MKTFALIFAVVPTICAAIVLGWYYQDQAGAVLSGAVIGAVCGWWLGFMAAVLTTRKPRPRYRPPVIMHYPGGMTVMDVDAPEISPAALEWHEVTHG